jgi:hypothetical protein
MNAQPKESEVRRLLSRALSRRRKISDVPSTFHLDLNLEFDEERHDDSLKYFFATLLLFGMLCVFCSWIGRG